MSNIILRSSLVYARSSEFILYRIKLNVTLCLYSTKGHWPVYQWRKITQSK